jgi:DNA-directed RNA polymerase beta' subunit
MVKRLLNQRIDNCPFCDHEFKTVCRRIYHNEKYKVHLHISGLEHIATKTCVEASIKSGVYHAKKDLFDDMIATLHARYNGKTRDNTDKNLYDINHAITSRKYKWLITYFGNREDFLEIFEKTHQIGEEGIVKEAVEKIERLVEFVSKGNVRDGADEEEIETDGVEESEFLENLVIEAGRIESSEEEEEEIEIPASPPPVLADKKKPKKFRLKIVEEAPPAVDLPYDWVDEDDFCRNVMTKGKNCRKLKIVNCDL